MTKPKAPKKKIGKSGTSKLSAQDKKDLFIEAYLSNGGNLTQSALAAGYTPGGAGKAGYRLSKDAYVVSMLDKRKAEVLGPLADRATRTLLETNRIAFSDVGKTIGPDGKVLLPNELDDDTRAAVKGFKIDEYGRVEYQFWDKNVANERIHKRENLYKENNESARPLTQVAVVSLVPLEPLQSGSVIDAER